MSTLPHSKIIITIKFYYYTVVQLCVYVSGESLPSSLQPEENMENSTCEVFKSAPADELRISVRALLHLRKKKNELISYGLFNARVLAGVRIKH